MATSIKEINPKDTNNWMQEGSKATGWLFVPVILLMLILTSVPSIYAVVKTPNGAIWTGLLSRNTNDVNGYLSIVEEIRSDGLVAHNLMTAEPHPAFQIRPFHTALAMLGRIFPNLSPVALLEIGRILASTLFLTLLARLVIRFYETTQDRVFAFLIITLGSGLGWVHLIEHRPDLTYSELSTFLSLVSAPLYQFSLSCVLGIILALAAAYQTESSRLRFRYSLLAALLGILLGLERPFSLFTLGLTMIVFLLIELHTNRHQTMKLVSIGLPLAIGAGSIILYQFYLLQKIPVYAEWNRQHIVSSPEPIAIFLSLGLLIPLAIIGIPEALKRNRVLTLLFYCYAISSLICSKLPVHIQERFLEGLPLSTALLASAGAIWLKRQFQSAALQLLFALGIIVLLIPSNILAMKTDLQHIARRFPPQFLPAPFIESMEILEQISKPGEPVLSLELAGNFLVAYSSRPAVIAHRIATARINEKKKIVTDLLLLQARDPAAQILIRKTNAKWLFWGPEEKDIARGGFEPEKASYLKPVYKNRMVTIYRINL